MELKVYSSLLSPWDYPSSCKEEEAGSRGGSAEVGEGGRTQKSSLRHWENMEGNGGRWDNDGSLSCLSCTENTK